MAKNNVTERQHDDDGEQELKSIPLLLSYPKEDGGRISKSLSVKVNKLVSEQLNFYDKTSIMWSMSFSLKIPDFIHSYLLGKTVPRRGDTFTYGENYVKTIRKETIRGVVEAWNTIVDDYCFLLSLEKKNPEKVIFYHFDSDCKDDYRSKWDGKVVGIQRSLTLKFFVGYVVSGNTSSELRYNINKQSISKTQESELYRYSFMAWSEERENFFEYMADGMKSLIERFDTLESELEKGNLEHLANFLLPQPQK